jgi:hypothetical protein
MFNKKRQTIKYKRRNRRPVKRNSSILNKGKKLLIKMISLAIVIFIIYAGFFSNYFSINTIKNAEKTVENEAISEKIASSISSTIGKNLIFINNEEIEEKIKNNFPQLEKVSVKKSYPKTLLIEFEEFPLVANVINESNKVKKTYVINSIGYAVKENYENPSLPYIRIKSEETVNPQKAIIEANKLQYIMESIIYFEDKFGMKIIETEYKPVAREIHLLTEKNFYIWLDIQRSTEEQLKKLKKALVKLDIYTENLLYIDLRIAGNNGDKIIYKRR